MYSSRSELEFTVFDGELPTRERAESYLHEAGEMTPGSWIAHSEHVAAAAHAIAEEDPRLDPETAYIVGLLHDIGRRGGFAVADVRHVLDGYAYMRAQGSCGVGSTT